MTIYTDIKNLKIQGAENIAIKSLEYLLEFSKTHGFKREFKRECKKLLKVRPTAVVLKNVLDLVMQNPNEIAIKRLHEKLNLVKFRIFENFIREIPNNSIIMTHCHSSDFTRSLIYARRALKYNFKVYVTETRPKYQGIITAKELSRVGIKVKFIVDSAAKFYMNDVDMFMVGTDAMRREGFVNKIGTDLMALSALDEKKPIYVVGSLFKLDRRKKLKIEMRPKSEVIKTNKFEVLNPAFELTPWKYVYKIISDMGIFTPDEIVERLNRNFPIII